MFWIDSKRGYFTDWLTQTWVKISGQKLDSDSCPWLDGASGPTKIIGLEAFESLITTKGLLRSQDKNARGVLPSFNKLSSASFDHEDIDASVINFYETTSDFSINLRSEWCWLFRPGGWLISKLFSERLQQLNVPLSNDDIGDDMTNEVQYWIDPESNAIELTLWLRSFKKSGVVAYSGSYSTCFLESIQTNCVKVVFPLPNGRAVVILRPEAMKDGSLRLVSTGKRFGDPGFYFVVESKKQYFVKYVKSFTECITVHPEVDGEIRADHELWLWGTKFLRMFYRIKTLKRQKEIKGQG